MGKNLLVKAENQFLKAEKLFKARQFKKAGKLFHNSGQGFLEIHKYESARDSFINSAKSFLESEKFDTVLKLYRLAARASLHNERYLEANELYRNALNYISNLKSANDQNAQYLLFSILSYLCLFIKAQQEEALDFLKRIQKKVDNQYFKESPLIKIATNLTIALRDKNKSSIERVKDNINDYKFNNVETDLLRKALMIAECQTSPLTSFELDKKQYTTNDKIKLKLDVKMKPLQTIFEDGFYNYKTENIEINKVSIHLSDNLTVSNKPNFPLKLELTNDFEINYVIKPHFQLDKPYIGPMDLIFELNDNLLFIYTTNIIEPNILSPPASLSVSIKNLRPPLIGQTFPLEILVENKSEGEALDVNIDVEFPDELKIMRGTTNKQIYSLRSNEDLKWETNLKPTEAGDYVIKFNIKFTDPDQNMIEEVKEFPFSIKL
ncbi:MAG: hypothetical protein ACFE85_02610 [Candidatus Hodarchaeota archaeon]